MRSLLIAKFRGGLVRLHPAYFAMVMATGVLAIACQLERFPLLPFVLMIVNLGAYAVLWLLTLLRALLFRQEFLADFSSHQRGPGFFTLVAATAVLGTELVVQTQSTGIAVGLWIFAFTLWLVLTYVIFTALTIRPQKPSLEDGINGGWLTAVVATQSLVVLGTTLAPEMGNATREVLFILVLLWLAGGMLYSWMISLIFYRYTFFSFRPRDLNPPYWINMGAMAISALAGAQLIVVAQTAPFLRTLLPFLKGFTLLYWATATWWIPMLISLGVWRYVYRKVPLTYDPLYWGAVFPLAMYTTATFRMATSLDLPFLKVISQLFVGAALTAWWLTFLGWCLVMAIGSLRLVRAPRTLPDPHCSTDPNDEDPDP